MTARADPSKGSETWRNGSGAPHVVVQQPAVVYAPLPPAVIYASPPVVYYAPAPLVVVYPNGYAYGAPGYYYRQHRKHHHEDDDD